MLDPDLDRLTLFPKKKKNEKMKNFQAFMLRRVFLKGWRPPGECIASWKLEKKSFSSKNIRIV
jgi:hypothetical protein